MNRSLGYFLVFCAVLAVLAGVAYWWAGPTLTRILFDREFRAEPIWVLHFANPEGIAAENLYQEKFVVPGSALITEGRGSVVRFGVLERQVIGSIGDQWRRLEILYFPTGAAFADVATSTEYRGLLEQLDGAGIADFAAGIADASAPEIPNSGILVVWLGESNEKSSMARFRDSVATSLTQGGREIWSGTLSHLSGMGDQWDLVYVLHFKDARQYQAWVTDAQLEADSAMLGRYLRKQSLLTYELAVPD